MDIENVPHSPHTGYDPTEVFNPLEEDFIGRQGGVEYIVPANGKESFPEFRAYHLAKHLAVKIVSENHYRELKQESYNPLNPNSEKWKTITKTIPDKRIADMMAWVLNPVGVSPEDKREKISVEAVDKKVEGVLKSPTNYEEMSWQELKKLASEKGFYNPSMTKKEVLEKLKG